MLDIPHLTLHKTGKGQIGSILTNFVQFCTRTTRLNTTELFREVVVWLGGDTTCVWYERGVDAEFQSWKGGWGSGEPAGGRGGLVGKTCSGTRNPERKGAAPALTTAKTTCLRKSTLTVTSST